MTECNLLVSIDRRFFRAGTHICVFKSEKASYLVVALRYILFATLKVLIKTNTLIWRLINRSYAIRRQDMCFDSWCPLRFIVELEQVHLHN